MELLLELVLTVSLSLIITSLFIKLVSMQPMDAEKHESIEEVIRIDRFQWMSLQEELIKFHEHKSEGNKSLVEFHNIAVLEAKEVESNPKGDHEDASSESEDNLLIEQEEEASNGGERKSSEIEIESVEAEEEGSECGGGNEKDEWVEIGRHDFEELLGNRGGSL